MSHLRLVFYVERPLYYKLYYYHTREREMRKFLFPKGNTSDRYSIEAMHPENFHKDIYGILQHMGLIEDDRWCSGDPVAEYMTNEIVNRCEPHLRIHLASLCSEKKCEICGTENDWELLVMNSKTKGLPICTCCKALLVC